MDFIFAPIRADILRAKVSAFVDLFAQQQQLQESLVEITALNAGLRDAHGSARAVLRNVADAIVTLERGRRDRGVQPIGATAVRLLRGGAHHEKWDGSGYPAGALAEMTGESGRHFDPAVLGAFLSLDHVPRWAEEATADVAASARAARRAAVAGGSGGSP